METFTIELHHGGYFVKDQQHTTYVGGDVYVWEYKFDFWYYFDCLKQLKEESYTKIYNMWYKRPGVDIDKGLKEIKDDVEQRKLIRYAEDMVE
jgi:hypothetical protein